MPPIPKITKEKILDKAFEIVNKNGIDYLNVRNLAKELNCSTQPILYYYKTMDELKKEIFNKCINLYEEQLSIDININDEKSYFKSGLNYINFAKKYPIPFKLLFMNNTNSKISDFIIQDETYNKIIKEGTKLTNFSINEQKEFHKRVWIITHGIATLIATNTITFTNEEIENILRDSVREMVIGYKIEKGQDISFILDKLKGEK